MRALISTVLFAFATPAAAQQSADAVVLQCSNEQIQAFVRISDGDFRIVPGAEITRASGWGENICAQARAQCALAREAKTFTFSDGGEITETYDWDRGAWAFLTASDGMTGPCAQVADPLAGR